MTGNRKLFLFFCTIVLGSTTLVFVAHRTVVERDHQLARLRDYVSKLSKATGADSSHFFSRRFKENIDKDLSGKSQHLERLNSFKGAESNYPANLILSIINQVRRKSAKDFAIPEKSDSLIRLKFIQLASTRVEFSMDFIDRENYLVIDNIHDLSNYFSYLECLELEKSKSER